MASLHRRHATDASSALPPPRAENYDASSRRRPKSATHVATNMVPSRLLTFVPAAGLLAISALLFWRSAEVPLEAPTSIDAPTCSLYLAPSSIPGGGLGLYSAKAISEGEFVGDPDICHQLIDMHSNTEFDNYRWDATSIFAEAPFEAWYVQTLCPGFGMAVNSHAGLDNIQLTEPAWDHDGNASNLDVAERRRYLDPKEPSFGAESSYFGVRAVATDDIPAGAELFLYYGNDYFESRAKVYSDSSSNRDSELQGGKSRIKLFSAEEYAAADAALRAVLKRGWIGRKDLDLVRTTLAAVESVKGAAELIPETVQEAEVAAELGTARANLSGSVRTISWLEQNGVCVDKIKPSDRTTIGVRSLGGFARKDISKEEIITATPVIHLPDPSVLKYNVPDIWQAQQTRRVEDKNEARPKKTQQIINYCFGHPDSSVLLYPYGPGSNLINCALSSSKDNSPGPNARLRWSSINEKETKRLLSLSPEDLKLDPPAGLAIDFVALRDIPAGEEVTIDCGLQWRTSWTEHVKHWEERQAFIEDQKNSAFTYFSYLKSLEKGEPIRTIEEQRNEPYPSSITVACYYDYENDGQRYADGTLDLRALPFTQIYDGDEECKRDGIVCTKERTVERQWEETNRVYEVEFVRPCDVLERQDSKADALYMVRMLDMPGLSSERRIRDPAEVHLVADIPARAIRFVPKLYSSDAHSEGVFRQYIGLPDEMVPEIWKNK